VTKCKIVGKRFVVGIGTYNLHKFAIQALLCKTHFYISLKYNQKNATFSRSIYFYKLLYKFQAVPPPIIRSTKLFIHRQVLSNQYCCLLLSCMRWNCLVTDFLILHITVSATDSTLATDLRNRAIVGNSSWLTFMIETVLCSWWWAEEPLETCREIYRNKQIEKTLHLFGCTLETFLRWTDIWTSNSVLYFVIDNNM